MNNPLGYIDPTGFRDVLFNPKDTGGWCEDMDGDWMCDEQISFNATDLWDPEFYKYVDDPKSAEAAFQHFVNDPGYFVNLYANPGLWLSDYEVLNLEVFAQYSNVHTTAENLVLSFFNAEDAMAIWDAQRYWALGLKEDAYARLGTVDVEALGNMLAATIFIGTPSGDIVPVPDGWVFRVADNKQGIIYQRPGSIGNANSIRIMDPSSTNIRYPNGRIIYYDSYGHGINPATGKPGSRAEFHLGLPYRGPLKGWPLK